MWFTETVRLSRHRKLIAGVVALALVCGGAGALAATQLSSSNPRQAFVDDLASRLHVTPGQLTTAVRQAMNDQARRFGSSSRFGPRAPGLGLLFAPQRFAPGRSFGPGALGTLFAPRWLARGRFFGPRRGFGMGFAFGPLALASSAAAGYLGITAAKLRSDLFAGKSLAQIASATAGKSVAGLDSALLAAAKAQLDRVVRAGYITGTQEAKRLARLSARLQTLVQRSFKLPAGGHWFAFRAP